MSARHCCVDWLSVWPGQHLDRVINGQVLEVEVPLLLLAEQVLQAQLINDGVPCIAVDEPLRYPEGSTQTIVSVSMIPIYMSCLASRNVQKCVFSTAI